MTLRIVVAPDSFKGSLSATEVCEVVSAAIHEVVPDADVRSFPLADGGEGTVDAMSAALGGHRVAVTVAGPWSQPVLAHYLVLPDGVAVIEMASAAGLPLVAQHRRPGQTTTLGVGELIRHAAANGAGRILVGLGGSATNDGGVGAAVAAGVVFRNGLGQPFIPVGDTLVQIADIDTSGIRPEVAAAEIIALTDVDNPLCGPFGAAAVFGPQKGARPDEIEDLDRGLANLASVIERDGGPPLAELPGAGAAGGLAAGLVAFFGAQLRSGIDAVLETVNISDQLAGADLVITGEGSFDSQSLRGKVISGLAARAVTAGVPIVVLAGRIEDGIAGAARAMGVVAAEALSPTGAMLSRAGTREALRRTVLTHLSGWLSR